MRRGGAAALVKSTAAQRRVSAKRAYSSTTTVAAAVQRRRTTPAHDSDTENKRSDSDDDDDEVDKATATRKRPRRRATDDALDAARDTKRRKRQTDDAERAKNDDDEDDKDDGAESDLARRSAAESAMPPAQLAELVATRVAASARAVRYVLEQTQQGATVPFLARYRQEETRHMDEHMLRRVLDTAREAAEVHRRRAFMLRSLQQRGLLTPELRDRLCRMLHLSQLEDLWEVYKERKSSLAARARDAGLATLAELLLRSTTDTHPALQSPTALQRHVAAFMRAAQQQQQQQDENKDAMHGAREGANGDVVVRSSNSSGGDKRRHAVDAEDAERLLVALVDEHLQRTLTLRDELLRCTVRYGQLTSAVVRTARKATAKALDDAAFVRRQKHYAFYDGKRWPVRHMRSHIVLALSRGEREGVLQVDMPPASSSHGLFTRVVCAQWRGLAARAHGGNNNNNNSNSSDDTVSACATGSRFSRYERHLAQRCLTVAYEHAMRTVHNTVRRDLRKAAERVAIDVFADNLRHMLLQRPLAQARLLAMDPGLRNGVKCVCLDEQGSLLGSFVCHLHDEDVMRRRVREAMLQHRLNKIVIGNGTASQETLTLIARLVQEPALQHVEFAVVSEAGASVYSVSEAAASEFPTLSPMYRGAVSIGRRVLDPLSELVKVPVRSMGIGMYQHDVNERALTQALLRVVESCVTTVGVVASSANRYVMQHVPGLPTSLLEQILLARHARRLCSRDDLRRVPGMTEATYLHIAGFFRFPSSPEPLDNTRLHPESYALVHTLLRMQHEEQQQQEQQQQQQQEQQQQHEGQQDSEQRTTRSFAAQCAQLGRRLASMSHDARASLLATALSRMQQQQQQPQQHELQEQTLSRFGVATLQLIADELQHPGLDPRASLPHAGLLRRELRSATDLRRGDVLRGIVQSVTTFGVFVDCGLHNAVLVRFPGSSNNNNNNGNSSSNGGSGDVSDVMRLWHVGSYVDSLVFDRLDELGRPQVTYTGGSSRSAAAAAVAGDVRGGVADDGGGAHHSDTEHHRLAAAVAAADNNRGSSSSSTRDGVLLLEFDDVLTSACSPPPPTATAAAAAASSMSASSDGGAEDDGDAASTARAWSSLTTASDIASAATLPPTTAAAPSLQSPRRRGRPRKDAHATALPHARTAVTAPRAAVKRTRASAASAAVATAVVGAKTPGKRGRKPKAQLLTLPDNDDGDNSRAAAAAAVSLSPSRGRPRRTRKMTSDETAAALSRAVSTRLTGDADATVAAVDMDHTQHKDVDAGNTLQEFEL